ncbi:hypothetical protein AX16_010178 [Volvariella volvacea WC 439]|nr:hypothetical protein AX16_010178 [Volvariella volvacea WC 439]
MALILSKYKRALFRGSRLQLVRCPTPHHRIHIPDDIILEVVQYLCPDEILQCCLLSRHFYYLLLPALYTHLNPRTNKASHTLVYNILKRPEDIGDASRWDLTRHVRYLTIRINYPSGWATTIQSEKHIDELNFALTLEEIARQGALRTLQMFRWDGSEAPKDSLWLTLRECCPMLKDIGTTVGPETQMLNPDSHLFGFTDLLGFSLTARDHKKWQSQGLSPKCIDQPLPDRLWDMLLVDSPNLQALTLDGQYQTYELWNIRRILSGRWPNLRSLYLGSLSSTGYPSDAKTMSTFLSHHRHTLQKLSFQGGMYYSRTTAFYLVRLPHLVEFSGKSQQLRKVFEALASSVSSIRSGQSGMSGADLAASGLPALRYMKLTDWFSPSAQIVDVIEPFNKTLRALSIYVNFLDNPSDEVCYQLYERVLKACPNLTHIGISATGPVNLKDFGRAILNTPTLQSFTVTRVRRITDEDSTDAAIRILERNLNSSLQIFTIRDVLDWDHHDQLSKHWRIRQVGRYVVIRDHESCSIGNGSTLSLDGCMGKLRPVGIRVWEEGVNALGVRYSKRTTKLLKRGKRQIKA